MDREVVLFVLAAVLVGAAMPIGSLAVSMVVSDNDDAQPGRTLERHAILRLLLPLSPAFLALAALFGWALVEPDDAERVPWLAFLAAVPALLVGLRAAMRAVRALNVRSVRSAATVGLFRPRVVVDDDFHRQVDERALEAALAHEEAHARHRDPLRIWIGQIATDLQWPLPGARARFEHCLFALELARDEEARAMVDGADLAAAVLAGARVEQPAPFAFAGIASAGAAMRLRVERLLARCRLSHGNARRGSFGVPSPLRPSSSLRCWARGSARHWSGRCSDGDVETSVVARCASARRVHRE